MLACANSHTHTQIQTKTFSVHVIFPHYTPQWAVIYSHTEQTKIAMKKEDEEEEKYYSNNSILTCYCSCNRQPMHYVCWFIIFGLVSFYDLKLRCSRVCDFFAFHSFVVWHSVDWGREECSKRYKFTMVRMTTQLMAIVEFLQIYFS